MDTPPDISWLRLAGFVRQHTHDMRNHLNGLDLEAALLTELVEDNEAKGSVNRLRQQIRDISMELRAMSSKFAPSPADKCKMDVKDMFLIWQDQASTIKPPPQVEWREPVGAARILVDLDAIARSFRELLANAVAFGTGEKLRAEVEVQKGRVSFKLIEPKTEPIDPSNWGYAPLSTTRRGAYGLGLWVLQQDIAASGGEVQRQYDPEKKTITTTLRFPAV
jgi:signal transduction histidine kinase